MIYNLVLLVIFAGVDIYLIHMGFNMEKVFRNTRCVQGYYIETMLISVYAVYWIFYYMKDLILEPVVVYLVWTSDYACSESMFELLRGLKNFRLILLPLAF